MPLFGREHLPVMVMGSCELTNYTCVRCRRNEMNYIWIEHECVAGLDGCDSDDSNPLERNSLRGFHCLRCRDELLFREIFEFLKRRLPSFAQEILSFVRRQPYRDLRARRLYRICIGRPYSTNVLWELKQFVENQLRSRRGSAVLRKANIDVIDYIVSFLTWGNGKTRPEEWNYPSPVPEFP